MTSSPSIRFNNHAWDFKHLVTKAIDPGVNQTKLTMFAVAVAVQKEIFLLSLTLNE